ncbi:MAG: ATP-binding protein [Sphaerochaetaceae bacterium]|nr:ATP-binding protein [Sphaerochaetaceae bacterium]
MRFYGRRYELSVLNDTYRQCVSSYGKVNVITGRRRIGKTLLAKTYASDKPSVYLFTSRKPEHLLCKEYLPLYEELTGEPYIGKIDRFSELFRLLLKHGENHPFVLIIDEFQEFKKINPGVYSDIQNIWDEYKFRTHVHVLFIGSVYSLMRQIFQDEKEPLFGRADRIMNIRPFDVLALKEVLEEYDAYSSKNLFFFYLITGGVPRYLEILLEAGCVSLDSILTSILSRDSFFIEEGKNLLIQEFGKEYGLYFSILELIATGRTSRPEMESILNMSVGGYLKRLEETYDIVRKVLPVGSKRESRVQKYQIKDHFIRFWFRFIHRYYSQVENDQFAYIRNMVDRDLSGFSGYALERLFIEIYSHCPDYSLVGTYWEKGNTNEIDLIAVDDVSKTLHIAEIKLNKEKISIPRLKEKSIHLVQRYPGYECVFEALSPEDIDSRIASCYQIPELKG